MSTTPRTHHFVEVVTLPKCDFCEYKAHFDGKTVMGPWANMCDADFEEFGIGLGLGKGQELIVMTD